MTAEVLSFIAGMIKLEMVASVLLLAIAIAVVGALGSIAWFVIAKLPTILQEWLKGFNSAVEKLAESVVRITADVSSTHANTVSANLVLATHDGKAEQILRNTEAILKQEGKNAVALAEINTHLANLLSRQNY